MALQETATDEAGAGPCFRPRRIGHTNIFVGDLDRSMAFYRNVIGIEEAWRRENICAGFVTNGNTHHDVGMVDIVNPQFRDRRPDLFHVAFELETQLDLKNGYDRAVVEDRPIRFTYDHEISQVALTPTIPTAPWSRSTPTPNGAGGRTATSSGPPDRMPNNVWKPGDTAPLDRHPLRARSRLQARRVSAVPPVEDHPTWSRSARISKRPTTTTRASSA